MTNVQTVVNADAHTFYLPTLGASASVSTGAGGVQRLAQLTPTAKPDGSGKIAEWGTGNNLPARIIDTIRKQPLIGRALEDQANMLISGGIVYGITELVGRKEVFVPCEDARVEEFFENSNIDVYCREAAADYYRFRNVFPQIILGKARSQIFAISCVDAAFARWGIQNPKNGLVDSCFVHANWEDNPSETDKNMLKYAVLDPYFNTAEQLRAGSELSYIYPVSGVKSGTVYYAEAPWHSLLSSEWVEIAALVPKIKKAILENVATWKYHVQIPVEWFEWKYTDWKTATLELKVQRMEDELKKFNDLMSGVKAHGKSLLTVFRTHAESGREYAGWKITAIDDKLKEGQFLGDAQEANSHILYALGTDPALVGPPGGSKGMGAGSGSDKRVAYNNAIGNSKPHQDAILEPIEFALRYNNIRHASGKRYRLWFRNYSVTTLDTGSETQPEKK